jgi:rRNA processing protein Krr1/Pno1
MGSFKGLKQVRKIVEDCIKIVKHPVYHVKVIVFPFICYSDGIFTGNKLSVAHQLLLNYIGTPNQT